MVTNQPLTSAAEGRSYFEKEDKSNYYANKDDYNSRWLGIGAQALGLEGKVDPQIFERILDGRDKDGNVLVQQASNGEHRPGWDLHFAPSKSISLAWAFGNEQQRHDMLDSHHAAVANALNYIERNLIEARVTANGKTERVATGNLIAAKFDHFTSREMDPQPHSHIVIANMTQRPDGEWRAVANEKLFARENLIALYENELSNQLKERGYSVSLENRGSGNSLYATLDGIDQKVLEQFSKRSEQIDKAIDALLEEYPNAGSGELRQMACLDTRQPKQAVDRETLDKSWNQQLENLGISKEHIQQGIEKASERARQAETERVDPKMSEYGLIKLAAQVVNEQESTFSKEVLMKTAARLSAGEQSIEKLERAFNELTIPRQIVTLDSKGGIYTTREMQQIEKEIVRQVKSGHDAVPAVFSKEQVENIITDKYPHLTSDQTAAVEHILTASDRIIGVQGDAGTGKTSILRVVREQLEGRGFRVRGLSFTGKAASEIEQGSGIKSMTLHSFLNNLDRYPISENPSNYSDVFQERLLQRGLEAMNTEATLGNTAYTNPEKIGSTAIMHEDELIKKPENRIQRGKEVWVVDEASMVGSRQTHALMKAAQKAEARVVLIGDARQLQAIEAGKMFAMLQEKGAMKTVEMKEILRQRDETYKDIVRDIASRRVDTAFHKMENAGKIQEIANREDRLSAIVKDYTASKDFRDTIVVTALNKDRNELNSKIRQELKARGKLGGREYNFRVRESKGLNPVDRHFGQSYHVGDIVTINKGGAGVKVGAQGRVSKVDERNHTITLDVRGQEKVIDVRKHGDKTGAYSEKLAGFVEGDKIVFLKNDKRGLGVENGKTGEIKSIDEKGNITVKTDAGKDVRFNIEKYNYIDHAYAVTDYKSQGQTSKEVIFHTDTREQASSYNSFYVSTSRGKDDVRVFTDDKEEMKKQVKQEKQKTSTLNFEMNESQREGVGIVKGERGKETDFERILDPRSAETGSERDKGKETKSHDSGGSIRVESERENDQEIGIER